MQCEKETDLFASRAGWLCWACLPEGDLVDEFGIKYPRPEFTKKDRRDANDIRKRLKGNTPPKKLGRPKREQNREHNIKPQSLQAESKI